MLVRRDDRLSMSGVGIVYSLLTTVAVLLLARESGAVPNLRGVAPQDEKYYQTAIIKCRDGSKSFPQERLNDDFCDCVDGTDEPGTNACPESKFYCKNVGHRPIVLFSSRVNDGICDCCDGSDEYEGKVTCRNICWEAGEKSREKLKKKLGVFKEGSNIRKQDLENSRRLRRQHEEELVPLKREEKHLKTVVDKLRADKEAVEKEEKRAQEEERIEKEERERREKESTPTKEEPEQAEESAAQVEDSEIPETTEEEELVDSTPENSDAEEDELAHLTEEERGRVIASRWTGEDVSDIKAKAEADSVAHSGSSDEDDDDDTDADAGDETDDHHEDLEDEDYGRRSFSQDYSMPIGSQSLGGDESWWSKLMVGPSAILKMFGFSGRQPVDISEADRIRKEFREASDKLHSVQSKITDLENRLKQDYGKDGEFYSFYEKCFELKDNKYTYKICPYKDATQQEGHSNTRLGRWQGFKDDYTSMVFEQGDRCWNGPERSLRVKMRCGTKLELRSVNEPSRCEYVAEFSTPALCLESRVQALEQQLVVQDIPQNETHDEL